MKTDVSQVLPRTLKILKSLRTPFTAHYMKSTSLPTFKNLTAVVLGRLRGKTVKLVYPTTWRALRHRSGPSFTTFPGGGQCVACSARALQVRNIIDWVINENQPRTTASAWKNLESGPARIRFVRKTNDATDTTQFLVWFACNHVKKEGKGRKQNKTANHYIMKKKGMKGKKKKNKENGVLVFICGSLDQNCTSSHTSAWTNLLRAHVCSRVR